MASAVGFVFWPIRWATAMRINWRSMHLEQSQSGYSVFIRAMFALLGNDCKEAVLDGGS